MLFMPDLSSQVEAPLEHGQTLYVTGSGAALGENEASNGVPLYTTPADYPKWTSEPSK